MRIWTPLALALALTAVTGCKKKKEEGGDTPKVDNGSGGMAGSGGTMAGSGGTMAGSGGTMAGSAAEPPKTLVGADLAKHYLDCAGFINSGDMDKFKSGCLADNFTAHDASMNTDMKSPDDVVTMFKDMKTGFPDSKVEPQVVLVNGRNIAAVSMMSGTNSGAMKSPQGEMPATNKKMGMLFFHRLKLDDANKATEEWEISDLGTMMAQLGMGSKDSPGRPLMDKGMDGAPMIVVAADDDKEKANLAAYAKSTDAFNAHKAADVVAAMTADAVESDQAEAVDTKGSKDLQKGTEMFMKAFSDAKVDITESWAAGDYVVAIGSFSGTNDGPLGKMKKTGKKVSVPFVEIAKFKDGKIEMLWRFRNSADFAMQLGLMKPPAAPPGGGSGAAPAAGSGSATK